MTSRCAAIVPAYNEGETIADVVRVLVRSALFSDVIVVDDGSKDQTGRAAEKAGAAVIRLPENQGKGAAMRTGVGRTIAPFVFFCDADLLGLTSDHLRSVLAPVLSGAAGMCVGLRDRGPFWTFLSSVLPLIGGERALRREIFESIPDQYLRGFRAELAMNAKCRQMRLPVKSVRMPGVHIRRKMQKVGFWKGLLGYVHMDAQLAVVSLELWIARLRGKF